MDDVKIIQQISGICDNLPNKMRKAKDEQHKTNQQIIDETGLSESTVKKFFAGYLSGPSIYDITAIAIALNLSLDDLMELNPPRSDDPATLAQMWQELDHKTELLTEKEAAVGRLLDRSRLLENGISVRDEQIQRQEEDIRRKDAEIKAVRNSYKPLVYGLCGLCILLTVVWGIYVILDAQQPDRGLIRNGSVSPLIWIGAAAVVVLLIMLLHCTISRWYRKEKGV